MFPMWYYKLPAVKTNHSKTRDKPKPFQISQSSKNILMAPKIYTYAIPTILQFFSKDVCRFPLVCEFLLVLAQQNWAFIGVLSNPYLLSLMKEGLLLKQQLKTKKYN